MASYQPKSFWDETLGSHFDITGTGHGAFGPTYNEFLYRAKVRAFSRAMARAGVSLSDESVLDVGCGTGFLRTVVKRLGCRAYTGFDIAPVAVKTLSASFPEDRFFLVDVGDDELDPAVRSIPPFRVVLCFDVIYHIIHASRFHRALANLWRFVDRGGHLFVVDYFGDRDLLPGQAYTALPGYVPHVHFRGMKSYDEPLLALGGVEEVQFTPMYAVFNRPMVGNSFPWRHPQLSWHIRRRLLESRRLLGALYRLDGTLTRHFPWLTNLKILTVRKA